MPEPTLEPGSPSDRIAAILRVAPPGTKLSRQDVAIRLSISPAQVDNALASGIALGMLAKSSDADHGPMYGAGTRLEIRPARLDSASSSTVTPNKPHAAGSSGARGPTVKRLPALDLSKLRLASDLPLPVSAVSAKGTTRHDALFDSLTADGMSYTPIDVAYQGALIKAAQTWMTRHPEVKARSQFVVRRINATECGVWRIARTAEEASSRPRMGRPPNASRKAA